MFVEQLILPLITNPLFCIVKTSTAVKKASCKLSEGEEDCWIALSQSVFEAS